MADIVDERRGIAALDASLFDNNAVGLVELFVGERGILGHWVSLLSPSAVFVQL